MKVLTVPQIRSAEENAVINGVFSYSQMMENAGRAATSIISNKYDIKGKRVAIVCGVGNNGGDGFVIANALSKIGVFVTVITPLGEPKTQTAKEQFSFLPSVRVTDELTGCYDFIIDALFGIGLDRTVAGEARRAVEWMNMADCVKIAVDIPSGITSDGKVAGIAFKADLTVTFIALKDCLLVPPASDYCGEIAVDNIGVPVSDYEYLTVDSPKFKEPDKNSHKGTFGTALLVAGSYGMCGAQILAAKSAQKAGVGIVKAAVIDKNYTTFTSSVPEAVTLPFATDKDGGFLLSDDEVMSCLSNSDALLIGPGMGQSFSAKQTVIKFLKNSQIPIVLDADGINAISFDINVLRGIKAPVIITPHPGEMARLVGVSVKEIQSDRIAYARNFSMKYGVITVLKGANTIIALPDGEVFINATGNYGMATAGSGDVLAGIMVSLLAKGYPPIFAAKAAVYLHGVAGDNAAKKVGKASLTAGDIITELNLLFE